MFRVNLDRNARPDRRAVVDLGLEHELLVRGPVGLDGQQQRPRPLPVRRQAPGHANRRGHRRILFDPVPADGQIPVHPDPNQVGAVGFNANRMIRGIGGPDGHRHLFADTVGVARQCHVEADAAGFRGAGADMRRRDRASGRVSCAPRQANQGEYE